MHCSKNSISTTSSCFPAWILGGIFKSTSFSCTSGSKMCSSESVRAGRNRELRVLPTMFTKIVQGCDTWPFPLCCRIKTFESFTRLLICSAWPTGPDARQLCWHPLQHERSAYPRKMHKCVLFSFRSKFKVFVQNERTAANETKWCHERVPICQDDRILITNSTEKFQTRTHHVLSFGWSH